MGPNRETPLDIIRFEHLSEYPGLFHGVFARAGGASCGPFGGLNIGLNLGDDPDTVCRNRRRMLEASGVRHAVFLNQVHGDGVLVVKAGMDIRDITWSAGAGKTAKPFTADAVVTNVSGLGLVIQTADCQAVILYDPQKQVVGNVHAGWRGSVAGILGKCVRVMAREFGCRPDHMLAGISPSLGPCCAEFIHYKTELPRQMWAYPGDGGDCFDFWKISCAQLVDNGLKQNNIMAAGLCTRCNADRFFSYCACHVTGRFATVAALAKKNV